VKSGGVCAVGMEKQLGLDPLHTGRMNQQFDDVVEEPQLNLNGGVRAAATWDRKSVADDRLIFFVNTEHITRNAAILDGYITGQYAGIKILKQQVGRGPIIPVETVIPESYLLLEHRTERIRRKVAKVEDLELKGGRHPMS
jgi:hypothetical protein